MRSVVLLATAIAATFSIAQAAEDGKIVLPAGVDAPLGYERIADYGSYVLYRGNLAQMPSNVVGAHVLHEADVLQFDRLRVDTRLSAWIAPAGFRLSQPTGSAVQVVQFVGPIKQAWLDQVRATGAVPFQYVESNGYLVWASAAARNQLAQMADARSTLQFSRPLPSFVKLGDSLFARLQANALGTTRLPVSVQLYRHAGSTTHQALEAMGLKPENDWTSVLAFENAKFSATLDQVRQIIEMPDVYWVGEIHPRTTNDEVQSQIVRGYFNAGQTGPQGPGYLPWLDALGFSKNPADYPIVDITDDGIGNRTINTGDPTLHAFGEGGNATRIVYNQTCGAANANGTVGGHGHINANIAAGYDLRANAVTPGARFPAQYQRGLGMNPYGRIGGTRVFNSNGSFDETACANSDTGTIKQSYAAGARISSNSWGCWTCSSQYDDSAQAYDVGTRDADLTIAGNQQLITIFAGGNTGSAAGTIGTPGNGKNMITVGASENQRPDDENGAWSESTCHTIPNDADNAMDVVAFSARGPAPGQRIKPEVIAPGTHITGTRANPTTGSTICDPARPLGNTTFAAATGTSHATPAVSGVASLAYWWISHDRGELSFDGGVPSAPSPALMKAWLIAHPTHLSGVGAGGDLPSNAQGYGMPNLEDMFGNTSKFLVDQTQILSDSGQVWTWTGAIADPTKPLRIALAYTDAAGAIGTSPQVNNLDLEVKRGTSTYRGNKFAGQWSTLGGTPDSKNNYEAVFLPPGANNPLTIRVTGFNIAGDGVPNAGDGTDQDFALVCNNCVQQPTFSMSVDPQSVAVCSATMTSVPFTLSIAPILGFNTPVTLSAANSPGGTTTTFSVNPASVPGSSTLTIDNLGAAPAGNHLIGVTGTAGTRTRTRTISLDVAATAPAAFALSSPANSAGNVALAPSLHWSAAPLAASYAIAIATDPGFAHIVYSATSPSTTHSVGVNLDSATRFFWRVTAKNPCGDTVASSIFTFTTRPLPGDCSEGTTPSVIYGTDFEADNSAWTSSGIQNTWATVGARTHSGTKAFLAQDIASVSDQRLVSPAIALPVGQAPLTLQFWNHQTLDDQSQSACFDGALLEVSSNAGASWTPVPNTKLLIGNYTGLVSNAHANPLAGMSAWCGDPQDWTRYAVDLDNYAGQTVSFRFRVGTDSSVGRIPDGFYLDDLKVLACEVLSESIFADSFDAITPR